ncbi:MAG: DUF6316 family protein [Pseudomonadota bacterium]
MRKSDGDKNSHFRSADRVVRMNDQWWFATREGDMGPYKSREDAEAAINSYIASQQFADEAQVEEEARAQRKSEFKGDPTIWDRQIDSI